MSAPSRPGQPTLSVMPLADLGPAGEAAIVRLCSEALGTDCGSLFGFLSASTHVLADLDGRLVGHACWTTRQLKPSGVPALQTAWVDAVTVAPAHQRRGIGSLVMRRLADLTDGVELRALGTERMGFFEQLGWVRWQGPTVHVLHDPLDTLMILRTASSPEIDPTEQISAI